MSKKNNRATRARHHQHNLKREKELVDKTKKNAEKRKLKAEKEEAIAALSNIAVSAKVAATAAALKPTATKFKRKGLKIRKHAVIRGIKITDAESKQKVKEILAAEEAMKQLEADMADGTGTADLDMDGSAGVVKVKKSSSMSNKGKKIMKKVSKKRAGKEGASMTVE